MEPLVSLGASLQTHDLSEDVIVKVYIDGSVKEGGGIIWDGAHVLV